jgi:hypothetical protein
LVEDEDARQHGRRGEAGAASAFCICT